MPLSRRRRAISLGDLAAEIEDEDALGMAVGLYHGVFQHRRAAPASGGNQAGVRLRGGARGAAVVALGGGAYPWRNDQGSC